MSGAVTWTVLFHPEFEAEFAALPITVQTALVSSLEQVKVDGPQTKRPVVDTLNGSAHANMKELRIAGGGAWRFAFAFDPDRQAVVLVGGDKRGANEARFYKALIRTADARFSEWIEREREGE